LIKSLLIRLKNNELIKTSFLTGIGTIITQVSGLIVVKTIAVTLGSAGVAMISQFVDFITMSTSIATGGIQQGVVKYVAQYKDDQNKLSKVLSTSLIITLVSTLFFGLIIFLSSNYLSIYLFQTNIYSYILKIFAVNIILFGFNTLLIKILNGIGEIKKLVMVNISNSLFGLFLTLIGLYLYGLPGVLLALSISQSICFFISLLFVTKSKWYQKKLFNSGVDRINVLRLLAFTAMGICSLVLTPFVNIRIRNYIIDHLSINDAGLWSGMLKLSNSYLGIITITLSYYYLPKLSRLTNKLEIRREIFQGQKIVLPVLFIMLLVIYLLREQIIALIYSYDFLEMKYLFLPQLIGDFLKISSFFLSYLMLAKAKTTEFIVSSIIFAFITYFISIFLINRFGLIGVVYAHPIVYLLYFCTMIYLLREYVYAK
jgi:O-antigen/teichoic acid export membrane protein